MQQMGQQPSNPSPKPEPQKNVDEENIRIEARVMNSAVVPFFAIKDALREKNIGPFRSWHAEKFKSFILVVSREQYFDLLHLKRIRIADREADVEFLPYGETQPPMTPEEEILFKDRNAAAVVHQINAQQPKQNQDSASKPTKWLWGAGPAGQVLLTPQPLADLDSVNIVSICCGSDHTLLLSDTGRVYGFGDNLYGAIGKRDSSSAVLIPMPGDVRVSQIAAGNTFSACLTEAGNVVLFGTLKFAGPNGKDTFLFKKAEPHVVAQLRNTKIVGIACGAVHMLLLKADGTVLSFGCPTYGRLGRKVVAPNPATSTSQSNASAAATLMIGPVNFAALKSDDRIVQIACGHQHNLALTKDGLVYSWGRALDGQLGYDVNREVVEAPKLVKDLSGQKIIQIACGANTSFALGPPPLRPVFCFGTPLIGKTYIQPAIPVSHVSFFQLKKIPIISLAAGVRHAVALGEDGRCYSWGLAFSGQTGHGHTDSLREPKLIEALKEEKITQIAAGGNTSCAIAGMLHSVLSEDFSNLLASAETTFSDLRIDIISAADASTKQSIFAHTCVLSARAPKLWQKVFSEVQVDSNSSMKSWLFSCDNVEAIVQAIKALFYFLYTDRIGSTSDLANKLAKEWGLAEFLEISSGLNAGKRVSNFNRHLLSLIPASEDPTADIAAMNLEEDGSVERPEYIGALSADVILIVEGRKLPVHKGILCARSEYYKTMFSGNMAEASMYEIEVGVGDENPPTYEAYLALMRFLYLDVAPQDVNLAIEVLALASMLHLHRLVTICEATIQQSVDVDSCCFVYFTAKMHRAVALQRYCVEFFGANQAGIRNTEFWNEQLTDQERDELVLAVEKGVDM